MIANYRNSSASHLRDVYRTYSNAKGYAQTSILAEMICLGGHDFRITTHSINDFTCAYQLGHDLIYHTRCHRYVIENWRGDTMNEIVVNISNDIEDDPDRFDPEY